MIRKIVFLFLLSTLISCTGSDPDIKYEPDNPCNDTRFLILKNKPEASLTEEELVYLNTTEKECRSFVNKFNERNDDKARADRTFIIILASLGAIMLLGLIFGLQNWKGHW